MALKPSHKMVLSLLPFPVVLFLWYLAEKQVIFHGASFGGGTVLDFGIFVCGFLICVGSIPWIYMVSPCGSADGRNRWISPVLWVYPLFLSGMFFQTGSDVICLVFAAVPLSVLVILVMHVKAFAALFKPGSMILKFSAIAHWFGLSVYYVLLISMQYRYSFLHQMKYGLRRLVE